MKKWLDKYQLKGEVKNSLNRTVTCSNCGWSWKLSDGGEDPLTCHKCGGTIKMKHGGELDKYQKKGEVKSTFNPYQQNTPILDRGNFSQDYAKPVAQNILMSPITGSPMTKDEAVMYKAQQIAQNQNSGSIRKTVPISTRRRMLDVLNSPMTSAQQVIAKQPITGRGPRNIYDNAVDFVNPFGMVYSGAELKNNINRVANNPGTFLNELPGMGLNLLQMLPVVQETKFLAKELTPAFKTGAKTFSMTKDIPLGKRITNAFNSGTLEIPHSGDIGSHSMFNLNPNEVSSTINNELKNLPKGAYTVDKNMSKNSAPLFWTEAARNSKDYTIIRQGEEQFLNGVGTKGKRITNALPKEYNDIPEIKKLIENHEKELETLKIFSPPDAIKRKKEKLNTEIFYKLQDLAIGRNPKAIKAIDDFYSNYKPVLDNPIIEVNKNTKLNFPLTKITKEDYDIVPRYTQPTIYAVKGNPLTDRLLPYVKNYAKDRINKLYMGNLKTQPNINFNDIEDDFMNIINLRNQQNINNMDPLDINDAYFDNFKQGGAIITNRGQWDYPGQTTIIPSNQITMRGVSYPVLGVDNTGYTQMMQPQMDYTFPGQYVTEYPIMKHGGEMIKRADGSYSRRGLWDNIRANVGSGKRPTKEMLNQERKIRNQYQDGGEEDVYWRTKQPMVNDPSMDAISKVLLQRNQDKNFMQRAAGFGNQNSIPTRYIDGEDPNSNGMSNLLMGFGDKYVSPTIIETFPNFLGNNSTMLRTAPGQLSYQPKQKQEYIKAPTEDIADYFAAKGYKRAANDMYGMQYQTGGNVPTIDGPSGYMNEDDVWIVDNETIKRQAQELGSKRVLTEGGSLVIFDDNWNIVAADDNPDAPYKQGGSVTLNAGGENHRIYVKTTNRGEGDKGNIMVNHPTMDKGMWDTIDLTKKSGAKTIAQGVAATKKWHRENPYMKEYGGDIPMYGPGGQNPPKVYTDPTAFNKASQSYTDSLNLYNYSKLQKKLESPGLINSALQRMLNADLIASALRKVTNDDGVRIIQGTFDELNKKNKAKHKNIAVDGTRYRPSQVSSIGNNDPEYDPLYKMANNIIKNSKGRIIYDNSGGSPDIISNTIMPKGIYNGAIAQNYDYSNTFPKQPVVYQPQQTINTTQGQITGNVRPNLIKGSQLMMMINPIRSKTNLKKLEMVAPSLNASNIQMKGQTIPLPQMQLKQQGTIPFYGPGNSIIGYTDDNMQFYPAQEYRGASSNELNLLDKQLLDNPEMLQKFVQSKDNYKFANGGSLTKYQNKGEVKFNPYKNEKSKLIFRNPVLETPCEGIGCAQLTSNELSKMNLIPSRTDAWFMGDAVVKDGGKQIWNKQSGNIDYSTLIPGDIITLDRPGLHHIEEMKNNPLKYTPEKEVEHVGVIVGHDERGVPLVKHGGNNGIRTVIQPVDKLSLYIPDSGINLDYKPFGIYRTKGAENIPIPDNYYNKQFAKFDNSIPLLKKQSNNTEKQNKMIDALNNNLEKQSRVLNLDPYDIQQLQKIAFGIYGNESKYGTSIKQKPKEYAKRFASFLKSEKWVPGYNDKTSPSLSEMRIKYDDIYGDGNNKLAKQFDELEIKEKNLKGFNSDNDYNDEANAAIAILVSNYNKIKNDKDEHGRSKYSYDPTKQTIYGNIPVTEAVAKMYNSGAGIINNESKFRKKPIYAKQAIENAYINFNEVPSLRKTFKNDVIINNSLKKPITKPLINTTPEVIVPENINPKFMYSTPPSVFANGGGIPERYRNMGFTNVGAKKQSTRPGKKWMVLAKKGDDYKVVHGGYKGMQDFKQHHSEQRKENFWSRMGGRNSSKATDPFSPLYWHKRFGTWEYGGQPMAVGGQNVMNPIVKKDNRNWLEYLKN